MNSIYIHRIGLTAMAVSSMKERSRPHREMTDEDVEGIISGFASAGIRAREAGFDAIQLHGAHGYLLSQFISPLFNHRTDRWGGSTENRRRFHLELVSRVHQAIGDDFPLLIKFGVQDDREGGLSLNEGLETAQQMVHRGIDAIEVSTGVAFERATPIVKKGDPEHLPFRERTAALKRSIEVPVILVGGIRSLQTAENVVDSGDADLLSMSRPLIRQPDLIARKTVSAGGDRYLKRHGRSTSTVPVVLITQIGFVLAQIAPHACRPRHRAGQPPVGVGLDVAELDGRALALQADVANFSQAEETVNTVVEKLGGLDILVCNAGVTWDGVIWKLTEQQWDTVIDTNLKGYFN